MSKTIIFDLGGVYFSNGTRIAVDAIADRYKVGRETVEDVLNGDAGKQYRIGTLSAEQFWQRAKNSWNIQESSEALALLWCASYRPIEGTVKLVDRLKRAGHQLLYLSDNTAERVAYLDQRYHFLQKFDGGIFSHLVKCRKPEPMIYQLLLAKALHPAAACVYIDDKPEYLEPAKDLGMEIIAFKNAEQLETDLKRLALLG